MFLPDGFVDDSCDGFHIAVWQGLMYPDKKVASAILVALLWSSYPTEFFGRRLSADRTTQSTYFTPLGERSAQVSFIVMPM